MRFFPDAAAAFRNNEITEQDVADWAQFLYHDDTNALANKLKQCGVPGMGLVQFQVVTLHRMAKEKHDTAPVSLPAAETPVPEEFMRDVPEPVYEDPLPDLAGEIKSRLGIIACVRKFGKPQEKISDRSVEGIKVRCPHNDHPDHVPSAWVNTNKNVWHCGKCMTGGDVIDFYAARQGLNLKTFHRDGSFTDLVREMGAELGLAVKKARTGSWEIVEDGEEWPSPLPDRPEATEQPPTRDVAAEDGEELRLTPGQPEHVHPASHEASEPVTIPIGKMFEGVAFEAEDFVDEEYTETGTPTLDWRDLPVNPHTFLGMFMAYAQKYYPWVPEEYYLFAGLQAIGLATGHHTQSFTGSRLTGSLMLAMIGPSGGGKSTAVSELRKMFGRIGIVQFNPSLGTGIKVLPSPGSAEALVKSIYTEVEDVAPEIPGTKHEVGVTAWLHEDEFATLVAKGNRTGSTLKPRIIQLYDFVKTDPMKQELVIEDFSLSGGMRTLHDSYFSAVFTTQTDAIRSMMESVDLISGFLNRIIPVMGPQRQRRKIAGALIPPPVPDHDAAYEALWRRSRESWKMIPFTDDALELVDCHPFLHKVENLAKYDSLYSRVQHMTLRIAFLLAVNNYETEVDARYVEAACTMGSSYLMGCFQKLRGAVIANEFDECAERIMQYVKRYYDKHGEWPGQKKWVKDRSYGDYTSTARQRALDILFNERRLVRIQLTTGKGVEQAFVIPDGEWAGYADKHEKRYVREEFYA